MLGPVTINPGQKTIASVRVFDQNGQDMTAKYDFNANPVNWSLDNVNLDTEADSGPDNTNSDLITSVAPGIANLSAAVGGMTDSEQIINVAPQVATSIKIDFTAPA